MLWLSPKTKEQSQGKPANQPRFGLPTRGLGAVFSVDQPPTNIPKPANPPRWSNLKIQPSRGPSQLPAAEKSSSKYLGENSNWATGSRGRWLNWFLTSCLVPYPLLGDGGRFSSQVFWYSLWVYVVACFTYAFQPFGAQILSVFNTIGVSPLGTKILFGI